MTTADAPAPVPLPAVIRWSGAPAFRLAADAAWEGDPVATAFATDLLRARTGLAFAGTRGRTIALRLVPGGPAESYRLVADAASVTVSASDAAGLFYGTHTLAQLVRPADGGWIVPAVTIEDAPRFAYRGVMLDVARHFFPVADVCAYIDRAASLKANALHLHLTDDQGWRIEIASRPELTRRAAGTAVGGGTGGFYTREDYLEIVRHAASRHVTVVPEIDGPGHTHAAGLAYPELAAPAVLDGSVLAAVEEFGGGMPRPGLPYTGIAVGFSSLRIREEATYAFLADVLGELAALTPGPYLHVGGDEAHGNDPDDYAAYVRRVTALVTDLGKVPIVWQEAGLVPALAGRTVGQYWGYVRPRPGDRAAADALLAAGHRVILSPSDAAYLDMKESPDARLGLTWADGPTSLERAYAWDPAEVIGADDAAILGVEAPLWTETAQTLADLDELALPRLAAAAEIAWSPRGAPGRTWESFRTRVGALAPLWRALGIGFHPSSAVSWRQSPAPILKGDAA